MDYIDKWLKSLRLHKYTHLFKSLTYEQMLRIEEKYLIDLDITKGARNKILVSVKRLNLRHERLIHMTEDLDDGNISMKEALTALKDILITPIPHPRESVSANSQSSSPSSSIESMASTTDSSIATSSGESNSLLLVPYSDPYYLTYLFVETFEKVALHLIESSGMEDNACHGIAAAIVDECLKHNSFTREQKARVASYKHYFAKEQEARAASYKHYLAKEQKARMASYKQHHFAREQQKARMAGIKPQQLNHHQSIPIYQHHQIQNQQRVAHNHHHHIATPPNHLSYKNNLWNGPVHHQHQESQVLKSRRKSVGSTTASNTSEEEERHKTTLFFREYSLLGPGTTFELPCLRAAAQQQQQQQQQRQQQHPSAQLPGHE